MTPAVLTLIGVIVTGGVTFTVTYLKLRADARTATADREAATRVHDLAMAEVKAKAAVELEAALARISQVDGPTANAAAFGQVFEVSQRLMLSLQADVARLEQRLNDQDYEHRVELQERDVHERDLEAQLYRMQQYVVVLQGAIEELGGEVPAAPVAPLTEQAAAPERRTQTNPTVVSAVVNLKE